MKKIILVATLFGVCLSGVAQKNNRTTAIMAYNKYVQNIQAGDMGAAKKEIIKAKEFIDKAAEHETTVNDSKTQFYKGEIYMGMVTLAMDVDVKPIVEQEGFMEEVKKAYTKAMELDDKNEYKPQIQQRMNMYRALSLNAGIEAFQKKEYEAALSSFEAAIELWSMIGLTDSLAYYNAALAADNLGKTDKAIAYYTKCTEINYGDEGVYQLLAIQYKQEKFKDSPERQKILEKGRSLFPTDQTLIIEEFNYHFEKGNNEKAQEALNKAIELDPKNPILYFNVGSIYDELKMYDKAEASYKKALEIDPTYFDALYNMGAMFVNQGVDLSAKANDIKDFKLYEAEIKKANEFYKKGIPFFERALEVQPDDLGTWTSVSKLYYSLDMNDKYEAAEKKIKELSK